MAPLVSIITTCFNAETTIERVLQSSLDQTFANWEHVLVDDGSTDASMKHAYSFDDPRFRLFRPGRIGRAKALNLAVNIANGEFLAILDADDFSRKTRLETQLRKFEDNPEVDLLYGNASLINSSSSTSNTTNVKTDHAEFSDSLSLLNAPPHSSVMYRRKLLNAGIGYNERCPKSIDYNFYLDCLSREFKFAGIAEPIVDISYSSNSWGKADDRTLQLRYAVLGLLNLYRRKVDMPPFYEFEDDKWNRFIALYDRWFDAQPYASEMATRSSAQAIRTRRKEMTLSETMSCIMDIASNKPFILLNRNSPISFRLARDAEKVSHYFFSHGF